MTTAAVENTIPSTKAGKTKKLAKKARATNGKPKAKKAAKKAKGPAESGVERSKDLPWSEKKVALFKALKHPKLNGGIGTAEQLVKLSNGKLTGRDVRHYAYHAKAGGLVKVEEAGEGEGRGYVFSLTAKGRAVDGEALLKERNAARKAKSKK